MENRRRIRLSSWVAGMAAYAVVLQLFLAGLVHHASGPSLDSFAICYGNGESGDGGSDPGKVPAHEPSCLLCTCGATGGPAIRPVAVLAPGQIGLSVTFIAAPSDWPAIAARHTPRLSQGPPARA